jgi:alkanesulfonate monooxygenase SsuD/methylene tetrahydromethanopterin reductase-like flavin-dependent oxidoreductase (luciferase family)
MKFGFYLPNNGPTARPEPLAEIARRGDELGFYCMVAGDHILVPDDIDSPYPYTIGGQFPGGESGEYLEQLTLLTYLAGVTKQIRLVPSVMIVPYRPPLLAAKVLATLDVLSQGRLILGVGVGWMEEEFEALGSPPFAERGAVTNEYLQAFKELWTSDTPLLRANTAGFPISNFCPSQRRSLTLLSGWGARAAGPSAGPPS